MDLALKGDKNTWHFEAFVFESLLQNQLNKLSNVISRSDIVSKNVFLQL